MATPSGASRLVEQAREVEALAPSSGSTAAVLSSICICPTISSKRAVAERGHHLAHFLGDEEEVVDDVLGLAGEALAQHRVLRGDADRAGVEVALAHHDAAGGDQRRGREAELVGAEQGADRRRRGRCGCRRRPARRCGRAAGCATSVWWVSARPISHGLPACLIEVSGEAPVPPS